MQFTKKQALEDLRAKLKAQGESLLLSDQTMDATLETLMFIQTDEMELNDFVTKIFPVFLSQGKNLQKEKSDYVKEQKSKKKEDETENPEDQKEDPSAERLRKLEERIASYDQAELSKRQKASLLQSLKDAGVEDTDWVEDQLSLINIPTEDEAVSSLSGKLVERYNKYAASLGGDYTPGTSIKGSGGDADKFASIKAEREARLKREQSL